MQLRTLAEVLPVGRHHRRQEIETQRDQAVKYGIAWERLACGVSSTRSLCSMASTCNEKPTDSSVSVAYPSETRLCPVYPVSALHGSRRDWPNFCQNRPKFERSVEVEGFARTASQGPTDASAVTVNPPAANHRREGLGGTLKKGPGLPISAKTDRSFYPYITWSGSLSVHPPRG